MNEKVNYRFIVDFMLGRLAKWLRIFGYDTLFSKETGRTKIVLDSLKENRILVTRDHKLSSKRAWKLILIKDDNYIEQIKQLRDEFALKILPENFFSRCSICNSKIKQVTDKNQVKDMVPEYVYQSSNDFSICPMCNKVYWQGTHWQMLLKDLKNAGILNGNN